MEPKSAAERLAMLRGCGPTTESLVAMVRDGRAVIGESRLTPSTQIEFDATNIRNDRTGVHTRIHLTSEGRLLVFDNLNIERDAERRRLSNSAAEKLGDEKQFGKLIKLRFDEFASRLWPTYINSFGSERECAQPGDDRLDFVLEPFALENGGTILFAPPGKGKSWTALMWTMALTYGLPPWVSEPRETMYVNLERPPKTLRRRMLMLGSVLGVPDPSLRFLHSKGGTLRDELDIIRKDIERHGIELVVLDSLSRTGAGDLNANLAANETMDMLNSVGVAWVALAHTPKNGSGIFGSRMFEAAADITVSLTPAHSPEGDKLGVHLEIDKANDLPRFKGQTWAFEFTGYTLTGLRPAGVNEFPDLNVPRTSMEQVISILEVEGSMTVPDLCDATELGRATVYRILKNSRFVRAGKGWGLLSGTPDEAV